LALVHPIRLHLPAIGHALLDPDVAVGPLLNPFDTLRLGPLIVALHALDPVRLGLGALDAVRANPFGALRLHRHALHARRLAFGALHPRRLAFCALRPRCGLRSLALLGAFGMLGTAVSARTCSRGRGRNRQGGDAGG
jgi:hypothetical protein